jgi:ribonuclease PH
MNQREDGRTPGALRKIELALDFIDYPEGSVLIKQGNTHVLCNVSVEQGVPNWMQVKGVSGGWITAEYAMLPRATHQRTRRETIRPISRNQEIRRLIGRSLRAGFHLEKMPALTCIVDCDVLQADGGTRTASITGSYVALLIALRRFLDETKPVGEFLKPAIAAVSVGVRDQTVLLDLNYEEDSSADADLNIVMNRALAVIEIQGTAERSPLPRQLLSKMIDMSEAGIKQILSYQEAALANRGISLPG